jgi:hypothetical protein
VVLIVASASVYPGGSYFDRNHPRHHFWYNFLCDLLHRQGLGGGDNVLGARLATMGMLVLVLGMGAYWTLAPALLPSKTLLGKVCMVAGLLSSLGLIAVALTPSDRLGKLHTLSIVLATAPGLVAGLCIVLGRLSEPGASAGLQILGSSMLLAVFAAAFLFVVHTWFGGGYIRALPTMQRVAALLTLMWLGTTTVRLL